ncbi:MAG: iron ABC transporter permease [Erysipelotrichaceae bacterium]|nr:iron ABC transporter permease [Erysipelotrichaceae bacterium]
MTIYTKSLKTNKIYILGVVLLLAGMALSLFASNQSVSSAQLVHALLHPHASGSAHLIFYSLRLPRALGALLCGSALSTAGLLLQRTLHNDLASPGILGINAGAGLFALIATLMWPGMIVFKGLMAFLGAIVAILLVLLLSHRISASKSSIILLGVAVSSLMTALTNVIITLIPESIVDKTVYSLGGFHIVVGEQVLFAAVTIIPVFLLCLYMSRGIELLSLGDETAYGLGLDPEKMRLITLICAALLSGAAVSICGLLGFVGLIIPNAIRMMGFKDVKSQLLLSGLYGSACLVICDGLIRMIFYPYELPVGLLLSMFGAPFFIYLLYRRRRKGGG